MANRFYNSFKNGLLNLTNSIDLNDAGTTIKVALIDETIYTYSASHTMLSDISGVVGTAQTINNKTVGVAAQGTFDGDDVTFTAVADGSQISSLLLYKDTGVAATSPLIGLIDEVAGSLPINTDGGNISISWNSGGILRVT